MAWSEALFLTCLLAGLLILSGALAAGHPWRSLWAAPLFGMAFLTRYAGVMLALVGAASLLFPGQAGTHWRQRLLLAFLFAGLAGMPVLVWTLINPESALGNRALAFHPVGISHLYQLWFTLSAWLQLPAFLPAWLKLIGVSLAAAGLFSLWLRQRRRLALNASHAATSTTPLSPRSFYLPYLLFIFIYLGFLAFSISWLDANTPLDSRILSPVWISGLILLGYAAAQIEFELPVVRLVCFLLLAGFTVATLVSGAGLAVRAWQDGMGFHSRAWQVSPLFAQLDLLPAHTQVYANVPSGVYLNTGRPARSLPRPRFSTTQQVNPDYEWQMEQLSRSLQDGSAVLLYVTNLPSSSVTEEQELIRALDLCLFEGNSGGTRDPAARVDGRIYTAAAQPCVKP